MPPSDEELPVSDSSPCLGEGRAGIARSDARMRGGDGSICGGDASPRGGDASIRGGDGSPHGGDASMSGGNASTSGGDPRPLAGNTSIHHEPDAVEAGGWPPPREQCVPPAEGPVPPREEGKGSREGPTSPREGDARLRGGDASPRGNRVRFRGSDASLHGNGARFHGNDASPDEGDPRFPLVRASLRDNDAPDRANPGPLAQVIPLHPLTRTSVLSMLGRPPTTREVTRLVAAKVPPSYVEDVVQDVFVEAVKAADRNPPAHEGLLPSWLATITRRVVADFLERRARRAKYEGDMPDELEGEPGAPDGAAGVEASEDDEPPALPEASYDPRAADDDEGQVDAWLARQWLEKQVAGDPRDEETLAILLEHAQGGKTYQDIARARGMSLTALSTRIFEFKGRYIPRYKRWRNRAVLLLVLGGVAIVAEIVLLLWLWLAPRDAGIRPDLYRPPPIAPSATVVAPTPFDQALPTRTAPAPDKPEPPAKPLYDKPPYDTRPPQPPPKK